MDLVKMCKVCHLFFLMMWLGSLMVLPFFAIRQESIKPLLQKMYKMHQLPSMLMALLFGIILFVLQPSQMKAGWFHMKLTAAVALVTVDIAIGRELAKEHMKKVKIIFLNVLTISFLLMALIAVYVVKVNAAVVAK